MFTWCTMPVPGGTTLNWRNASWPQRRNWNRSRLRPNSSSTFRSNASGRPKMSATTEWSMTSSAGTSGLILAGSPPRSRMASRMVARSTTAGTPVRSCRITRAGVNWISVDGSASGSHWASAVTCSGGDVAPVLGAQQVLQQDLQAERKTRRPVHRVQPVYLVLGPAHPQRGQAAEAVRGHQGPPPDHRYLDIELSSVSHVMMRLSRRQATRWGCQSAADRAGCAG